MGGLVFVLFSACCTILAVICVTVFGASAQFIVNMYFIYLMFSAVALLAAPVCIFLVNLRQKWAGNSVSNPLDQGSLVANRVSGSKPSAISKHAITDSLLSRPV